MKLIARIFALSLVVTGAVASAHIAGSAQPVAGTRASAWPQPMCPPDGTTDCGMCQLNGSCPQQQ